MNQENEIENWNELTRRLNALPITSIEGNIIGGEIPADDPTGFVELAQTLGRVHREQGIDLAQQFPFFESLFSPIFPWQAGAIEAYDRVDALIKSGLAFVAPLQRGTDYEIFNDAGGEVTTFHFKNIDDLRLFREKVGIDIERGFDSVIEQFKK